MYRVLATACAFATVLPTAAHALDADGLVLRQNGAIIGLAALTAAFAAEALVLGGQLVILRRGR